MLTPRELDAFQHLQSLFSRPSILTHFDPQRRFYIDMDASKEHGFGAYAYHVLGEQDDTSTSKVIPKQKCIQPILFLSKDLTEAEKKYWPTKLEVACLVWVVQKLCHLVEPSQLPTIIYTDHSTALQIVCQSVRATVQRCDRTTYDVQQVRRTTYNSTTWSHTLSKPVVSK